jgi:hypothetical protein
MTLAHQNKNKMAVLRSDVIACLKLVTLIKFMEKSPNSIAHNFVKIVVILKKTMPNCKLQFYVS